MKKLLLSLSVLAALSTFGEASGDRPDARHAWAVHDPNRPDPVKVTADEGKPPSDAIVLFDGTAESIAKNWRSAKGGPSKWKVENGRFVCVPGSGPAVTKESFADCQLHVEWLSPVGDLHGFGNSGVIFMGQYEIQILNSFGIVPSKSPWKAANYADGQAGAVYGQSPCLVNPARPTGVWQTFDIIFHPPLWEGERLVDPGSLTVFFNGVLVQDHWQLEGRTTWCRRLPLPKGSSSGPLYLQDHGNPVPFRNVWIRRIPSRYANTVCGGPGVKEEDVRTLRAKLAAETRAAAEKSADLDEQVVQYWSSFAYKADAAVKAKAEETTAAYAKRIAGWDSATCRKSRRRLNEMKRFTDMLAASGFIPKDAPILKEIKSALAR